MSQLYERDLTEREMAEAMLHRSRNNLHELVINTLFLESRVLSGEKHVAEMLKTQIARNKEDMEMERQYIAFLTNFVTVGNAVATMKRKRTRGKSS